MSITYPEQIFALAHQPDEVDVRLLGGTFVKEIRVPAAHTALPQHSHAFPHVSVIVRGAVRLFEDRLHVGDFHAPCGILIRAHAKHLFVTLTDDVVILCCHDGDADIAEEHTLEMGG